MRDIWMAKRTSRLGRFAAVTLPGLVAVLTALGTVTASAAASSPGPARSRSVAPGPRIEQPDFQICGNSGSGYCLNDWNGTIGDIKMYYGGYTNDDFYFQYLNTCAGGDQVLGAPNYCPFSDHAIDSNLAGDFIVQIASGVNPGWCLGGSTSSSLTIMQPCNNGNGTGGGTGTLFVQEGTSTCNPAFVDFLYVNRYWSNRYNTYEYLESGNALGAQANEDYSGSNPTCWNGG